MHVISCWEGLDNLIERSIMMDLGICTFFVLRKQPIVLLPMSLQQVMDDQMKKKEKSEKEKQNKIELAKKREK